MRTWTRWDGAPSGDGRTGYGRLPTPVSSSRERPLGRASPHRDDLIDRGVRREGVENTRTHVTGGAGDNDSHVRDARPLGSGAISARFGHGVTGE
jgi:hypothetical protein